MKAAKAYFYDSIISTSLAQLFRVVRSMTSLKFQIINDLILVCDIFAIFFANKISQF